MAFIKPYKADIDIMFGDRFDSTVKKCTIDGSVSVYDMLVTIYNQLISAKPYLKRRKEFDIYWSDTNGKTISLTFHND